MVTIVEEDEDQSMLDIDPSKLSTEDLRKEVERLRSMVKQTEDFDVHTSLGSDAEPIYDEEGNQLDPNQVAMLRAQMLAGQEVGQLGRVPDQMLKYSNGDSYKGDVLQGKFRDGKGVHTCACGDYYDGEWKADTRHGWGTMTFVHGLTYEGQWVNDKTEGYGVCKYQNGGTYNGEWKNDHRWGWGLMKMVNGDSYEGEWIDDIMEGKGRLTYLDGSYFEGEFSNNGPYKGKFLVPDGTVEYVGRWKNNQRHGYGTYVQAGVYRYMGEWEQDLRHGRGKCVYAAGGEYDGEFARDKHHGQGKWITHEQKYEGQFVDSMRDGQGTCTYANGDVYKGEWKLDVRFGTGMCVFGSGDIYEGEWAADKKDGKGTQIYANKDKYQGEWKADKRHGYGVCFFADGTKFRGEWEDNMWIQSAADPEFCKVLGPGIARGVAGEDSVFGIQARDEIKNRRLCGGDEFNVMLEGPGGVKVYGTLQDNDDGTYVARYNCTIAGKYQLYVTLGADEQVAESPYPVRILPSRAFARTCKVVGEGRRTAVRLLPAEFHVEVKDRFGNTLTGNVLDSLPLQVSIRVGDVEVPSELQEDGKGRVRVTYTAPQAGFYRLDIRSGTVPLGDSPYSLQVKESLMLEAATDPSIENSAPVQDQVTMWEQIAMVEFGADGEHDGWDSDPEVKETKEQKTIRENPDTPVLENYEDLYKLPKLQQMQKEKKEREQQAKLLKMRKRLEAEKAAMEMAKVVPSNIHDEDGHAEPPAQSSIADLD
mmetsp:Transcript_25806/g.48982  ORF Transcript_25806/g.48982 Transcript_25806/m.48982 type:complete len:758 (+) Transcript_25806:138-2411(+)